MGGAVPRQDYRVAEAAVAAGRNYWISRMEPGHCQLRGDECSGVGVDASAILRREHVTALVIGGASRCGAGCIHRMIES